MQNTPTKQPQKRVPKDVPQMSDAQKEALLQIPDLYSDPRSLVQIWRDAGVPYQEAMPPPDMPNYQRHRRQTNGSQGSFSSPPYSNGNYGPFQQQSSALVPLGAQQQQQQYGNNAGGGDHRNTYQHTRVGSYGSPMKQPAHAASHMGMGNPATAFFAPGQSMDLVATNGHNNNNNNNNNGGGHQRNRTEGSDSTNGSIGSGSVLDGNISPPSAGASTMPAPGAVDNELELIFQNIALKRRVAQAQQQQQRKPNNNNTKNRYGGY